VELEQEHFTRPECAKLHSRWRPEIDFAEVRSATQQLEPLIVGDGHHEFDRHEHLALTQLLIGPPALTPPSKQTPATADCRRRVARPSSASNSKAVHWLSNRSSIETRTVRQLTKKARELCLDIVPAFPAAQSP